MFGKKDDSKSANECPIEKIYKEIKEHSQEKTRKKLQDVRSLIEKMDIPLNGNGNGNGDSHSVSL